jgi:Tfp pilus assembly protein PilF
MSSARRFAARALALGLALCAAGCGSFTFSGGGRARELPPEQRAAIERARLLVLDEHFEEALAELRAAAQRDPLAILVQRELQELQIRMLRKDDALLEAEARLAREPERGEWLYLRGRIEDDPEKQSAWFERALRADPDLAWAAYGLGIAALRSGDLARAEELVEAALRAEPENVDFLIASVGIAQRQGRLAEARERTLRGAARFPENVRFALALVSIELEAADRDAAFRQALRALRADPLDPAVYGVFLDWLHADDRRVDLAALELGLIRASEALRESKTPRVIAISYQRLCAHVAAARGRHEAALLGWRRATAAGLPRFVDFEDQRRARIRAGFYEEAFAVWEAGVPPGLLEHPAQRFRARWQRLREASAAAQRNPRGAELLALALAYRDAGWLEEALLVASRAELLDPSLAPEALALAQRIDAFQSALDELQAQILSAQRGGPAVRLEDVLAALQTAAVDILGSDPGPTSIESLSVFATRVDPTLPGQGLGRLLEAFGRFAVLGQVLGGPIDVFAMREIHRRDIESELLGRPLRGNVVVGEAREISALAELGGPDIAGAAVHEGYFVNLDVVRDWATDVEELRRVHGTPERRARLLAAPLLRCERAERTALDEPLHVAQKLALRAALREDPCPIYQRLFELVSIHERAHLADAAEFLPVGRKPFSMLGFLIAAGFSAAAIEARLEMRAELSALAAADEPDLVLSHIVSYALEGRSSAHARGFRILLERFLAHLDEHLDSFPKLDPSARLIQQLHLLENEEIRRVALALAREEGLVGSSGASTPR